MFSTNPAYLQLFTTNVSCVRKLITRHVTTVLVSVHATHQRTLAWKDYVCLVSARFVFLGAVETEDHLSERVYACV